MLYPLSYGRISFLLSRDNEEVHYTQVNPRPKQQARGVNYNPRTDFAMRK